MARLARVAVSGYPYHLTHRGNRGDAVFFSDEDREVYLLWLGEYAKGFGLEIWAYCLMTNHVHLLVVPRRTKAMDLAIGRTHMRHARRVNREQGWSGHLWANRFYSTILDRTHLWAAVRYIERNPVRAGLVKRAERYKWSSARCHAKGIADALLSPRRPFREAKGIADWSAWLAEGLDDEIGERLRKATSTGRPCGSDAFVRRLERRLGRTLTPQKPGPKPKRDGNK